MKKCEVCEGIIHHVCESGKNPEENNLSVSDNELVTSLPISNDPVLLAMAPSNSGYLDTIRTSMDAESTPTTHVDSSKQKIKERLDSIVPGKCSRCDNWVTHIHKAGQSRNAYRKDRETYPEDGVFYFSVDMQKVIMLPCLLGELFYSMKHSHV